jgi:hypothetical protein
MAPATVNKEQFQSMIREGIADVAKNNPQLILDALANADASTLRASLIESGFNVSESTSLAGAARDITAAYRQAQVDGVIVASGFGARERKGLQAVRYFDPVHQRTRRTFIFGENEKAAESWIRSILAKDGVDTVTGKTTRAIVTEMNAAVRAPGTPLTQQSAAGVVLVPTLVAAEIFEELNERFVLQTMTEHFTSANPLRFRAA